MASKNRPRRVLGSPRVSIANLAHGFRKCIHLLSRIPGVRPPLLLTSLGRAYLAFCSPAKQEKLLATLAASNRSVNAAARNDPAGVQKMLEDVRQKGYAIPDPDFNSSSSSGSGLITGFSVPVFCGGEVFASLSTSFLISAMSLEKGVETLLPALKETADTLSELISKNYG